MIPFLKHTAQQIFDNYKDNMQEVHVLVPNKRAILYLKHYLSEIYNRQIELSHFNSIISSNGRSVSL